MLGSDPETQFLDPDCKDKVDFGIVLAYPSRQTTKGKGAGVELSHTTERKLRPLYKSFNSFWFTVHINYLAAAAVKPT
jgi:hypothetical protein